jgi:hypothetical protein
MTDKSLATDGSERRKGAAHAKIGNSSLRQLWRLTHVLSKVRSGALT